MDERHEIDEGPLRTAHIPLPADPVLIELAAKAAARLPELCTAVTREIAAQMTLYGTGRTVPRPDLEDSVRGNLRSMIVALTEPGSIDLARARDTGTQRAKQGAPLPEVLRAFRIGFSALWDLLLDVASGSGEAELRALIATATTFWFLIDEYLEAVTAAYRRQTSDLVREQRERRAALLDSLFSGSLVNERAMWDTAQALDLPHDGCFTVVAAESGELGPGLPGAEQALSRHGIGSVWRQTSSYELGIISLGSHDRSAEAVAVLRSHARARVGVSPSFDGLGATARALRLAHVARSSIAAGEPWVAGFADAPVAMLVAAAPAESSDIAHQVLRPLVSLPAPERTVLLDTLDSWIAAGGSVKKAAEHLHCHPNTVRYRLQRVQSELKLSLTDPTSVTLVVVALRAWRRFGAVPAPLRTERT